MATLTRKIVHIDEDKCTGCGLCVPSCAEGAIQIIDGKARLIAENLCDGLGNCLGNCPEDAIIIEERPAEDFDETAVEKWKQELRDKRQTAPAVQGGGCPGARMRTLKAAAPQAAVPGSSTRSQLGHWPVQLMLVPGTGKIWTDADVLIAADCVPFAAADFHSRLLAGKTLAIGCPKLDDLQTCIEKLANIFASNSIKSITVAHMEVPCCFALMHAVTEALAIAEVQIPLREIEVGIDGEIRPKP